MAKPNKASDKTMLIANKLTEMKIPNKMSNKEVKLYASLGSNAQMVITPSSATSGDMIHQVKTEKGIRDIAKAHYDSLAEFKQLTLSASRKQKLQASRKAMKLNCAESEDAEYEEVPEEEAETEELDFETPADTEDNGDNPSEEEAENELYNSISQFTSDVQVVGAVIFNSTDPETGEPVCYVAFKDAEEGVYAASMVLSDSSFATADELAASFFEGGESAPAGEDEESTDFEDVEDGGDF